MLQAAEQGEMHVDVPPGRFKREGIPVFPNFGIKVCLRMYGVCQIKLTQTQVTQNRSQCCGKKCYMNPEPGFQSGPGDSVDAN